MMDSIFEKWIKFKEGKYARINNKYIYKFFKENPTDKQVEYISEAGKHGEILYTILAMVYLAFGIMIGIIIGYFSKIS